MSKLVYLALALVIVLSTACITFVQPGATAPGGTATGVNKPAAYIDLISPSSLVWGEEVSFTGHGTAPAGTITGYRWRSSVDGDLSTQPVFTTNALSPGKHIVLFSVQDSAGNWSLETQGTVNVITDAAGDTGDPADTGADPGSGTPAPTPPVINSFNASPAGITAGSVSTLSWNVSNATTVTVNNGVGSVGLTGTREVTPAVDTTYTLTAANAAYFGQATTKVTVAAAAAPQPDLIIEDVWKSGDKIYYRIKNQGTAAAPGTVTRLTIDGALKSTDSVPALAAGAASTQNFSGYVYTCSGISDSVVVLANSNNVVTESNGSNNSMTKTLSCLSLMPLPGPLLIGKPDLKVSSISYSPAPAGKVGAKIVNDGIMGAGPFDVKLYVGGAYRDTAHVASLNSGASTSVVFPLYHHICLPGSHATVKVVADTGSTVTESDETNNFRSVLWGCPPL